jgi:endonuclease/exonuclease/phosphatase family metal-dependent hydrolase
MVLTVVSLNTWGLPWPISRAREERFAALPDVPALQADVVGLQEVWNGAPYIFNRPLLRPGIQGDSGLGFLTDYPVHGTAFFAFRDKAGVDHFKVKGVYAAELEIPEIGRVWVASIHAQSGTRHADPRAIQLRLAADWLDEIRGDSPVIWVGDFNLEDHDPVDVETSAWLEAAGFEDAGAEAGEPTWHPENTWVSNGNTARYDRIYVKDGTTIDVHVLDLEVVLDEQPLSDHYGLLGRLRLEDTSTRLASQPPSTGLTVLAPQVPTSSGGR